MPHQFSVTKLYVGICTCYVAWGSRALFRGCRVRGLQVRTVAGFRGRYVYYCCCCCNCYCCYYYCYYYYYSYCYCYKHLGCPVARGHILPSSSLTLPCSRKIHDFPAKGFMASTSLYCVLLLCLHGWSEADRPKNARKAEPWLPSSNKIRLDPSREYARILFGMPAHRRHFLSALEGAMLSQSDGCVSNIDFFTQWSLRWTEHSHPGRALQAARRSGFSPQ